MNGHEVLKRGLTRMSCPDLPLLLGTHAHAWIASIEARSPCLSGGQTRHRRFVLRERPRFRKRGAPGSRTAMAAQRGRSLRLGRLMYLAQR
jgi:hypothetical protein